MNGGNKRKISLIVSDIDATLTWGIGISDANRQAIIDIMNAGILFGIASGRGYEDLCQYAKMWKIGKQFDLIIGLNGSSLYDERRKKDERFFQIETDDIKLLIEAIDKAGLECHIYADGITLFSKESEHYRLVRSMSHRGIKVAEKLSDLWAKPTAKILINVKDEEMERYRSYFGPFLKQTENRVKLIRTAPGALEFVPKESDKFYALNKYCQRYGIPIEEVAAFGDTTNDNGMIAGAGLGVCMKNGTDDTKALADVITEYECLEDGFARFIYEHIL